MTVIRMLTMAPRDPLSGFESTVEVMSLAGTFSGEIPVRPTPFIGDVLGMNETQYQKSTLSH